LNKEIGKRIRDCRLEAGISARQLAARIGCTPANISKIENGRQRISVDSLILLSRLSGKSCDWILTGKEHGGCSESKEAVIEVK
jgi:transcriptional regulator with XRE-family HTH domain